MIESCHTIIELKSEALIMMSPGTYIEMQIELDLKRNF